MPFINIKSYDARDLSIKVNSDTNYDDYNENILFSKIGQ